MEENVLQNFSSLNSGVFGLGPIDSSIYFETGTVLGLYNIFSKKLEWIDKDSDFSGWYFIGNTLVGEKISEKKLAGFDVQNKKITWVNYSLTPNKLINLHNKGIYDNLYLFADSYKNDPTAPPILRIVALDNQDGRIAWEQRLSEKEKYLLNTQISIDQKGKFFYYCGTKGIYCYKIPE